MKKILLIFCTILLTFDLAAQYGTSSGSLSYVRNANGNSKGYNHLPKSETIIVEDFFNYHLHQILIPQEEEVALSIDYDSSLLKDEDTFVLQVGIATQPTNLRQKKQNKANIALVIDVSSSMSGQKIISAREAARRFVESLNDGDYISLIVFNGKAKVIQPAVCLNNNRKPIYKKIEDIVASGFTNINEGMVYGYKEVSKYHTQGINSRVVLLTDGQTNRGITNPEQIVSNSMKYNNKGIEISTIGVGRSLDFELLRLLADKGRGSNYFIGDNEEDMYKVFREELDAILYGVGKEPKLKIEIPKGWNIAKCYGYKPVSESENSMVVDLPNLGANSTRVVLLEIRKNGIAKGSIQASFSYKKGDETISMKEVKAYDTEWVKTNEEISKNHRIAYMANRLKDAASAQENGDREEGEAILNHLLALYSVEGMIDEEDMDMKRVYDIVKQYTPQPREEKSERYGYIF
ncbi:MAG: VWA domain-containing protein [Dysgonomonas sp.]|nr:VWA domain-containing protein [Dysgonomonas sp.]